VIIISKDSWHHKAAVFGGLGEYDDQTDLCSYARALMWAALVPTLIITIASFFGYILLVTPLALIAVWIAEEKVYWIDSAALAGMAFWCIGLIAGALGFLANRLAHAASRSKPTQIIGAAYQGWKEKTCVLVEIKDGK